MNGFQIGDRVSWRTYNETFSGVVTRVITEDYPIIFLRHGDLMVKCDGDTFAIAVYGGFVKHEKVD